jgi:hypothetical protein
VTGGPSPLDTEAIVTAAREVLEREAQALAGLVGQLLVVHLDGERKPNRPGASGLLSGLTTQGSRAEMARAAEATARGAAVQAAAIATGQRVATLRTAWAPATGLIAEPRRSRTAASNQYTQAVAVDGLDAR